MIFVEIECLLKKNGWYYYASVGSHIQYKHKNSIAKITIPKHRGNIKDRTLKIILNQTDLKMGGNV